MPKRKDHKWITGHLNVIRDRGNWLERLEKIDGVNPGVLAEIKEFVARCEDSMKSSPDFSKRFKWSNIALKVSKSDESRRTDSELIEISWFDEDV